MTHVLVLAKKSALRVHLEGGDPDRHSRVEKLLRAKDITVQRMAGAHAEHEACLVEVKEALSALGCEAKMVMAAALDEFKVVIDPLHHSDRPGMSPPSRRPDLVITVGGDGTLLAASHAVSDTPILAINSAPGYSVGFFCGGRLGSVRETLEKALEKKLPQASLTRMKVEKDGNLLTTRVLNEVLVCSASPAATTRYLLEHRGALEEQKSSGIWIGPAAGSTAAQRSAGGRVLPLTSDKLQFVVREPYTPAGQTLKLVRGLVNRNESLELRVKMSDGRIFVDGPHEVHTVTIGDHLRFSASDEPLHLLGVVRRRGWKTR
ncbi:MAG: NAD(+)/NADH kinase [Polyangiales bacterium]